MIRYEKSLNKRLENRNGRQLILMGNDRLTEYVMNDLKKMNIPVIEHIKDDSLERMLGEKYVPENVFVLVAVCSGHKSFYEKISQKGFIYNQDFALMSIGGYCRPITAIDPLLSYCREETIVPQYYTLGNGSIKIAVYGSSTSDEGQGGEKSWSYLLYEFLKDKGIDTTIYNGAVAGYNSAQEVVKMIRDIPVLKPDIIISFSGVNDVDEGTKVVEYPFINKYQKRMWENIIGIEGSIPDSMDMRNMHILCMGPRGTEKQDYEMWLYHEQIMHAVCVAENIKFVGILEPMISNDCYHIEEDLLHLLSGCNLKEEYFDRQRIFTNKIKENINKYPYILDMSTCFKNMTEIFSDYTHCNLKGRSIIAKFIGERLLTEVAGEIGG